MATVDTEDLLAGADIADLLGVSTAAVANWATRYEDFPKPVLRVARNAIPLFDRTQIVEWATLTGRITEED